MPRTGRGYARWKGFVRDTHRLHSQVSSFRLHMHPSDDGRHHMAAESQAGSAEASSVSENHDKPPTALNILVIDDDDAVLHAIGSLLRRAAYCVHCACDGDEGWKAFNEKIFDAIVTAHDMPRLSGLNLIRRVRAVSSNLPIVLISGRIPFGEPDLEALLRPGVIMQKPFTIDELITNVRAAFAQREAVSSSSPANAT